MGDAGAWLFVRELLLEMKERGLIDDAFLERLVGRVERVVDKHPDLPEAQINLIRLSIDEVRDLMGDPPKG